jgi:type IV pilus assembly protein PilO
VSLSLKKLPLRQQLYIFALIAALTALAAAWLVFLPQWERVEQARTQYRTELQQVRFVEVFVLDHSDMDAYLAELDQKQAALDKMLPETASLNEYLVQLESTARQSGVKLAMVKPVPPADKNGYFETQFEVTVKGSFFQILSFVKLLDEGPRFASMNTLSLHAQPGGLESKLVVRIFSMKK